MLDLEVRTNRDSFYSEAFIFETLPHQIFHLSSQTLISVYDLPLPTALFENTGESVVIFQVLNILVCMVEVA